MKRRAFLQAIPAAAASQAPPPPALTFIKTAAGVEFAIAGPKPAAPAPTLLVFGSMVEKTLISTFQPMAFQMARQHGFLLASLDLPAHGSDRRAGEPEGLAGWRYRVEKRDELTPHFVARASAVLDYLIAQRYTDPAKIAVAGTSRGGFMAFHFAAADARVQWIAAFAPVTQLSALTEFQGMPAAAHVERLALEKIAGRLAGRPAWVCIGNNDERVGTDVAIEFTRRLVDAALAAGKRPEIELLVHASLGHTVAPEAFRIAAGWLAAQMGA